APLGLRHIGLDAPLAHGAGGVALVFALSLPTYVVACAASFWLEALSRATPSMLIMWGANVVNVLLLLLFVPGTFGLPAMGAVGGAWATFGARAFLMIGLLAYIASMRDARELGVFSRPGRDLAAE